MKRLVSFSAAVAFTAWILPLGFFIKPSQEKTACGGQRPFHMCSMMKKMRTDAAPKAVSYQSASAEKTQKAAAGSGADDFLIKQRRFVFGNSTAFLPETLWRVPSNPFLHPLDPVPKP